MTEWARFAFGGMFGAWLVSALFFVVDRNNAGDIGWAVFCTVVFVVCYWIGL